MGVIEEIFQTSGNTPLSKVHLYKRKSGNAKE